DDLQAFLSSHQTSIAQLAVQYCNALVNDTSARAAYFPGLVFTNDVSAQQNVLIDPLIDRVRANVDSQPADVDMRTELQNLVTELCTGGSCSSGARTPTVVKAVCGAALGSAAMLVQ
ncbi:MAG: LamG domain-containing protein, partial [Steroidobacteraceae bacterium]